MFAPNLHLAVIEITSNCNLSCKHCYGFYNKNLFINLDDFKDICFQLKDLGVSIITLSGGEPLMVGNLLADYLEESKKLFQVVQLTTNGTLINKSNIYLLKNVDLVQVSLDGPQEIHDYIRGKGNFVKTLTALKLLKKHNIKCSIMMTVNPYNLSYLNQMVKIAKILKVPIGFERITNVGRGKNFCQLSKKESKKLINVSIKLKIKSSDPLFLMSNKSYKNYLLNNHILGGCMAGNMAICIDTFLNVLPCARLRVILGNLKQYTLTEILKRSEIVQNLSNRMLLKGKCGSCKYKFVCGGCRAMAYAKNKDYLDEDPGCFYNC